MKKITLLFACFCTISCFYYCNSPVEKSQWRGPYRNGVYNETNLLKEWPENGPELLWKSDKVGFGYSSVAVISDKIITIGIEDSLGFIIALDLDGKILWKNEYGEEWTGAFPGTRSTPAIYDNYGYFISGLGVIYCFNIEDVEIVWSKDVFKMLDGENIRYGITENLVIDGEKLFCTPGGIEANVIALNRNNGEIIWKSKGNSEKTAYCSPIIINHFDKKYFITNTAKSVISIDIENGELMWKYDLFNKQNVHANTPIYKDGYLFVMDGFEAGSIMLKIADDGKSVKEIWKKELLDETNGHSVLVDENLYISAESKSKFCCVDWKTGKIKYSIDRFSPGTVIAADGMLYCYSYEGDFGLLKPTGNAFELKGSFSIPKEKTLHISHPVIKDGRLYVRYRNSLLVYDLRAKE